MSLGTINETMAELPNRIPFVAVSGSGSKSASAATTTTIKTFDITAGEWLLLSYMDFGGSAPSGTSYNHNLGYTGNLSTVRSTPHNGGGSVNWLHTTVNSTTTITISGYSASASTMRCRYIGIKLRGGVVNSLYSRLLRLVERRWRHESGIGRQDACSSRKNRHGVHGDMESDNFFGIWRYLDQHYNRSKREVYRGCRYTDIINGGSRCDKAERSAHKRCVPQHTISRLVFGDCTNNRQYDNRPTNRLKYGGKLFVYQPRANTGYPHSVTPERGCAA